MRNSNPNNQEGDNPQTAAEYLEYAETLLGNTGSGRKAEANTQPNKAKEVSYTDQVNELIKQVTVDEDTGKFVYPDNTPEHLKYAVAAEKKYRDTQGSFTKAQQQLKEGEVEREALRNQLATSATLPLELSQDDEDRLDELKYSDPSAWRHELNRLESEHSKSVQEKLNTTMSEVRAKAGEKFELDRRVEVLNKFNDGRETPLTASIFDNDIPPRIGKKLTDGLITFEGYLSECSDYIAKTKVVSNPKVGNGTTLNSGAGSHTPPNEANQLEQGSLDYSSMTL